MKTKTKACIAALCAVVLVAASVFATVAYLTSTAEVTNTFTYGKVAITLDEAKVNEYGATIETADRVTGNKYKLIPGHSCTKDPTIHVSADSENCWLFAKVENGLGEDAFLGIDSDKWTLVPNTTNVYAYNNVSKADDDVIVFESFTFGENADPKDYKDATITVTAYAVQADGFKTAVEAWNAANFQ
ncbi:MAG: hypothetical protein HFE65_03350 [Clostridiales bacterium]|nr:hypothetical protein [Clostridiales bacterium]